jgi:signal transduction histidine kinase
MVTKIALIISIGLQVAAAFLAIRLTKVTKYNLSWVLISTGFLIIAITRVLEIVPFFYEKIPFDLESVFVWLGLVTSLILVIGVILIKKIFIFIKKVEQSRREAEKRVLNAVIQTEEKERKRFAKDLHDGLGPLLSSIKMSISTLSTLEQQKVSRDIIENTDMVINEAIKSIKEISNNLSPHILNNFGLSSAINAFVNKINLGKSIAIHFESTISGKRYSENVEVLLYRVVCELVNNTLKHADAHNIEINLTQHQQLIILSYSDDGVGFDINEVMSEKNEGMGYSNIFSRIRSIKGKIDIESNRDEGTRVIIRVNLVNAA